MMDKLEKHETLLVAKDDPATDTDNVGFNPTSANSLSLLFLFELHNKQ